jgi:hypothetical protein
MILTLLNFKQVIANKTTTLHMFKKNFTASFLVVFMLTSTALFGQAINGSGNVIKKQISMGDFSAIALKSSSNIVLVEASSKDITIEADEKFMPFLECVIIDDCLTMKNKNEVWFNLTTPINIYVPVNKQLKKVINNGSGNISSLGSIVLEIDDIELKLNGSGKILLTLECTNLTIDRTGSSSVNLKGNSKHVSINCSGSGEIIAPELSTETIDVKMRGSSRAKMNCTSLVHADLHSSSSFYVSGNPEIIKSKNSTNHIYLADNKNGD